MSRVNFFPPYGPDMYRRIFSGKKAFEMSKKFFSINLANEYDEMH